MDTTFKVGTRVKVIKASGPQRAKDLFIGYSAEIIQDWGSGYRYTLKFDDDYREESNINAGKWCWKDGDIELLQRKTLKEGTKVLVTSVHRPEDTLMNVFVGHTAEIKETYNYENCSSVTLKFDNKKLELINDTMGYQSFSSEEVLDLTDLCFEDPEIQMPRRFDTVVVVSNSASSNRNKYINQVGIVDTQDRSTYCYHIAFNHTDYKEKCSSEGGWLWTRDEVMLIKRGGK